MSNVTIANCLQQSTQLAAVSDSPRLDVEILLAHILQKNRTYLLAWPETLLNDAQAQHFQVFFARRANGEPIAHIVGVREFWSLPLMVDNSTLIPRPDSELLVETVLNIFPDDDKHTQRQILDLGTGTGAIILALAHEKKNWRCVGVDKAPAAVALAEKNRINLHLNNVQIQQSDWFSSLAPNNQFDVIVSNPPYIAASDPHLDQGDVRFEPRSALVAENQGLADIEIICDQAKAYLKNDAWLAIEHGYDQGESVRAIFSANHYSEVKTLRDMGGNERVTFAKHSFKA